MAAKKRKMASKGGLEKQWVILIVIAVALAALVGLLFLTGTFVGQAIQFEEPTQDGEAGIFTGVDSTLDVGQKEVFPIIVNLGGSESQAVSYAYTVSGATLNCVATKDQTLDILSEYYVFEDVDKDGELVNISLLLGELNQVITCNPNTGVVTVEAAWICNGGCDNILEDQAEVGEVVLQANQVGDASIKFTSFTTLKTMEDEDVTNVVTSLSDASFAIVGTIEDLPGTELPDQGLVDTTGVDTTIDDNGLPAGSDTGAQPDGPLPGTDLPEQDLPDTTGVDTTVDDLALEFPPTSQLPGSVCNSFENPVVKVGTTSVCADYGVKHFGGVVTFTATAHKCLGVYRNVALIQMVTSNWANNAIGFGNPISYGTEIGKMTPNIGMKNICPDYLTNGADTTKWIGASNEPNIPFAPTDLSEAMKCVDWAIANNKAPALADASCPVASLATPGPLPGTDLPEQDLPDTTGVDTTVDDPALEFPPTSPLPKVCDGKGPKGNAVVACILHHIKELEKVNDNPSNLEYAQAVATGAKEYFKVQ